MDHYEARLRELGVTLPTLPKPIANYVPTKRSDNLAVADAQAGTRACVVNCLAAIKAQIGSLDRIKQVLAVHGLVNSTLDCGDQALAMNGASDFVVDIFGDAGRHVRTAAGVASLPMGFAASVYMIVEVE